MPVTAEQLKTEFPEFAQTSATLINAKLGDARLRCNAAEYGEQLDSAVKYLACHLIAMSPAGEALRLKYPHLQKDQASTFYEQQFNEITRGCILAAAVA